MNGLPDTVLPLMESSCTNLNASLLWEQVFFMKARQTILIYFLGHRNTLQSIRENLKLRNESADISTSPSNRKSNQNSRKPEVLRLFFRAVVKGNRQTNGRHQGT